MDLQKHPLTTLDDGALFTRLGEECSEVIHAIFKRQRFGDEPSPRTGLTGLDMIKTEIADLRACLDEVARRGIA